MTLRPRWWRRGGALFGHEHRRSWIWSWAFVAQAISSATSLGLSLLAGRVLGASGLGVVFLGFSAYLLLLALHRALVTTPLISTSSMLSDSERILATRTALTVTLTFAGTCAVAIAALGGVVNGPVHEGLLVFAPWLIPAFARELLRSSLFRDGRGRQAALMDAAWLCTMVACVPFAVRIDTAWAVVAAWGIGSVVAAAMGAIWMSATPTRPSVSRGWFVRVAFPFGRWLTLQEGILALGFYTLIVILTAILGTADLGGLRAAESIFAPFTLLAPALMLAGLPAASRALTRSRASAVELAVAISTACVLLTLVYSTVMVLAGPDLLTALFGPAFEPYAHLVVPISAGQIALAVSIGFTVLLIAEQRGKAIIVAGASAVVTSLATSPLLAVQTGVRGAVWGISAGLAVGSCLDVYFGLRGSRLAGTRVEPVQATTVTSP